jgi:outer membrane protein assembly factor BamB
MSAVKILDLAEEQGLLEPQVIATLRKQVQSKQGVTADLIAKTLVDKKLLTPFQAKKLLAAAKPAEPSIDLTLDIPEAPKGAAPAAEEDEDLVMLEAVEPSPAPPPAPAPKSKPASQAPAKKKPAVSKAPPPNPVDEVVDLAAFDEPAPAPKQAPRSAPPPKPQPAAEIGMAPMEEDLAPVKPAAPQPAYQPPPAMAPVDLMPIAPAAQSAAPLKPLSAPAPAALAPSPIDDLLSPLAPNSATDPFASPAANTPPAAEETKPPPKPDSKKKKRRENVWDSPLLLIGGGAALVLAIALVGLIYAMTKGTASEEFTKADEAFRNQDYPTAIAAFEKFIEKHAHDAQVGKAKVLLGMAKIRQASDNAAKDPRTALRTTKEVLPEIEREESFADVRDQFSSILPDIADGFAEHAKVQDQISKKLDLTKLADEALVLANNPSYIPTAQKKNIESRLATITDKLTAARRSISQDEDLQKSLGEIKQLMEEGKTADSYRVRTDLVRRYPGLEVHPQLVTATLAVSERERQSVRLAETAITQATDDARPSAPRVVLASRTSSGAPGGMSRPACILLEGAVYGLDLASGKILWRRYVGHETLVAPLAVSRDPEADVLVIDGRTHDLYRLEAQTGKIRWRLPIGEPFFRPTIADDKFIIATAAGKLIEVDAASGASARRLVMPQKLAVPAAYDASGGPRIHQLGEHSTLFVINPSLACEETYYLGHKAGAILVPPVSVLGHVLILESPADDHTLLHILVRDPKDKKLHEIGSPQRLKGRVVVPIGVAGKRITIVTDLGEVNAYEIDASIKDKPLQPVGKIEASEAVPTLLYQATDGGRLWLAGRRCTMFEIQVAVGQLGRKWTLHQDDAFLAAPQIFGDTLIHMRRRPNSAAVLVEACTAIEGKTLWVTQLGAPLIAITGDFEKRQITAISSQGRVFEVPPDSFPAGTVDQPAFAPPTTSSLSFRSAQSVAEGRWVALGGGSNLGLSYDATSSGDRSRLVDFGAAAKDLATPTALYKQGLVMPLTSGRVELINATTAKPMSSPFQPPLAPGARVKWNPPTVLSGDRAVIVGDGQQTLYRLALKEGAQPALSKESEARVEGDLVGPIAASTDLVYAVVREPNGDFLQVFQAGNLATGVKLPLGGRWKTGPFYVGDKTYVELQERKLLCIDQDRQLWQADLPRGPLSSKPHLIENDLLVLHASGAIARLDVATGKELGSVDVGEPLGDAVTPFGKLLLVGGRDGVLHAATPPSATAPAATPSTAATAAPSP